MEDQSRKGELINKILTEVKNIYTVQEITWQNDVSKNKPPTWRKANYVSIEDLFLTLAFRTEEELEKIHAGIVKYYKK